MIYLWPSGIASIGSTAFSIEIPVHYNYPTQRPSPQQFWSTIGASLPRHDCKCILVSWCSNVPSCLFFLPSKNFPQKYSTPCIIPSKNNYPLTMVTFTFSPTNAESIPDNVVLSIKELKRNWITWNRRVFQIWYCHWKNYIRLVYEPQISYTSQWLSIKRNWKVCLFRM